MDKAGSIMLNFVGQYRRPFNLTAAANLTGLGEQMVSRELQALADKGMVREVEPGIWRASERRMVSNSNIQNGIKWVYKVSTGEAILKLLEQHTIDSIRELARRLNASRQYAYLYLEALATIGAVAWVDERYVATGAGDIMTLGCRVEKGILHKLRRKDGQQANG